MVFVWVHHLHCLNFEMAGCLGFVGILILIVQISMVNSGVCFDLRFKKWWDVPELFPNP